MCIIVLNLQKTKHYWKELTADISTFIRNKSKQNEKLTWRNKMEKINMKGKANVKKE